MPGKMGFKRKPWRPSAPLLPPEPDDVEVSEDDIEFVEKHKKRVGFLANLDTDTINKQVLRLNPDQDGDLETYYEKRAEQSTARDAAGSRELTVDPVDALPVKSLTGELHYRTKDAAGAGETYVSVEDRRALVRKSKGSGVSPEADGLAPDGGDSSPVEGDGVKKEGKKVTKAQRKKEKKKLKKEKEAKKVDETPVEEPSALPSAAERMDELDSYISIQEKRLQMKDRMAQIGTQLLASPDQNVSTLKELQEMCNDRDEIISQLAMLSAMAVFKDLVPGYRIRLPTQKELEMPVSKEVRKVRDFESALLRAYQVYVQTLVKAAKSRVHRKTALRCMCGLLDAAPHFNFRESLLAAIIPRMNSDDAEYRAMTCEAIRVLFKNNAKHGGHATVEAVQLIADFVKLHKCYAHPDVVEVFLALQFDEDLTKSREDDDKSAVKQGSKQQLKESKRKKQKLAAQLRKEVEKDFQESMAVPDATERKKLQSVTLAAVFETYFRVLKTSLEPPPSRMISDTVSKDGALLGPRPLLAPSLEGLAKFAHLINVDFMGDLLAVLRKLSGGGVPSKNHQENVAHVALSTGERLQCCIIAFKIVRNNMDALNVDLREFYVQLFNLLYEVSCVGDMGPNAVLLAQALQVLLWEGRQHDMQRTAAFIKRLSTISLHSDVAEAMAALITVRHLLHRNKKCRNILENDGGGGAVGGSVAMFQLDATDPDLSGALSSVLWDVALLRQHYHPSVAALATELSLISAATTGTLLATMSPTDAAQAYSTNTGGFRPAIRPPPKVVRRRVYRSIDSGFIDQMADLLHSSTKDDEAVQRAFSSHFRVVRDHAENQRLRTELARVTRSLALWEEYKETRQQKRKERTRSKKKLKV